jgi:hypothetical protein
MAEQIGQCAEVDAAPGFHRFDTERYGEMFSYGLPSIFWYWLALLRLPRMPYRSILHGPVV